MALPEFPLIPASKGFCISLRKALDSFKEAIKTANIWNFYVSSM